MNDLIHWSKVMYPFLFFINVTKLFLPSFLPLLQGWIHLVGDGSISVLSGKSSRVLDQAVEAIQG